MAALRDNSCDDSYPMLNCSTLPNAKVIRHSNWAALNHFEGSDDGFEHKEIYFCEKGFVVIINGAHHTCSHLLKRLSILTASIITSERKFKFRWTASWSIIRFMCSTRWPTSLTVTASTPREFQRLEAKWHTQFVQFVMQYFKRGSYSRLPRYVTRFFGGWVTNRRCQHVLTLNVNSSIKTATTATSSYPSRENLERNVQTLPTSV